MSERYAKLFSLPADLYAAGSPVVVSAGNLLKDNQTGRVLVQLKIKNVSPKTLKGATVVVHALDTAGLPLDGDAEKEYLDFSAAPGAEFGQKVAIPLPRDTTRGFTASVSKAVFADNSVWTGTDAPWEPLPAAKGIDDRELAKQFQLTFGGSCECFPKAHKDLWLCACGAWNKGERCYACGKEMAALLALNVDVLNAEKKERVAREKAAREAKEAADKVAAEAQAKKTKKLLSILLPAAAASLAAILLVTKVIVPNNNYMKAQALLDAGQYEKAIAAFEAMDGYKDSEEQVHAAQAAIAERERLEREAKAAQERLAAEQERLEREAKSEAEYVKALELYSSGQYRKAYSAFQILGNYKDAKKMWMSCGAFLYGWSTIATGKHTMGIKEDGTVVAVGDNRYEQCAVSNWKDIVAIDANHEHAVGLKTDGTVVAVGSNKYGEGDVSDWRNIIAVALGYFHTVCMKADGTIMAIGYNKYGQCDVSDWRDIKLIDAGAYHTVGLKEDGTVIAVGDHLDGRCDVSGWESIVDIAAGAWHTVGLKEDGTVVAVGKNSYGQCNVSDWENIIAIAAGSFHTVGLRADGTVVATQYTGDQKNYYGQCDVSNWKDIVAIETYYCHTIGLKTDGTVVSVGDNQYGQCDVSTWTDIRVPER